MESEAFKYTTKYRSEFVITRQTLIRGGPFIKKFQVIQFSHNSINNNNALSELSCFPPTKILKSTPQPSVTTLFGFWLFQGFQSNNGTTVDLIFKQGSKELRSESWEPGTEHLLLTSAAQVGYRQQPLLRRVESADLVMPWSNGEQRRPHAVSCPQPADTGDTDNRY